MGMRSFKEAVKPLKGLLHFAKLQIVIKSQRKLSNVFRFKDRLPSI